MLLLLFASALKASSVGETAASVHPISSHRSNQGKLDEHIRGGYNHIGHVYRVPRSTCTLGRGTLSTEVQVGSEVASMPFLKRISCGCKVVQD